MFTWDLFKNEMRRNVTKIMFVVLLLLLVVEVISIIRLIPFVFYWNLISKSQLQEIKDNLYQTYNLSGYDFISSRAQSKMFNEVDEFGRIINQYGTDSYIISFGVVLLVNSIITILTLLTFGRLRSVLLISCIMSLGIVMYFSFRLMFNNYALKHISYRLLNLTTRFRVNTPYCVICYSSLSAEVEEKMYTMNLLALALHAYKCCGMKSHEDVMYKGDIPYTCCERISYKLSNVANSTQCDNKNLYPPCIDKILPFVQSMFIDIKVSLVFVAFFNGLYLVILLVFIFKYNFTPEESETIYDKPDTAKKRISKSGSKSSSSSSSESETNTSTQTSKQREININDEKLVTKINTTPTTNQDVVPLLILQ